MPTDFGMAVTNSLGRAVIDNNYDVMDLDRIINGAGVHIIHSNVSDPIAIGVEKGCTAGIIHMEANPSSGALIYHICVIPITGSSSSGKLYIYKNKTTVTTDDWGLIVRNTRSREILSSQHRPLSVTETQQMPYVNFLTGGSGAGSVLTAMDSVLLPKGWRRVPKDDIKNRANYPLLSYELHTMPVVGDILFIDTLEFSAYGLYSYTWNNRVKYNGTYATCLGVNDQGFIQIKSSEQAFIDASGVTGFQFEYIGIQICDSHVTIGSTLR